MNENLIILQPLKNMPSTQAHIEAANELLIALKAKATKRSQHWISDAVKNVRDGADSYIDDACDDFVTENMHLGKNGAMLLVNDMLCALDEPAFFELE